MELLQLGQAGQTHIATIASNANQLMQCMSAISTNSSSNSSSISNISNISSINSAAATAASGANNNRQTTFSSCSVLRAAWRTTAAMSAGTAATGAGRGWRRAITFLAGEGIGHASTHALKGSAEATEDGGEAC